LNTVQVHFSPVILTVADKATAATNDILEGFNHTIQDRLYFAQCLFFFPYYYFISEY
jgi:hypothetical protein